MRKIEFYSTESKKKPVEDFLDGLTADQAQKVTWVMQLVEEFPRPPKKFFKKLVDTDGIWEIRIMFEKNIFRVLGFHDNALFIATNGFTKKTPKTPTTQITIAEKYKKDYLKRKKS